MMPSWVDQRHHRVRFEWGPAGVEAVRSDVVVIVDVLRFSTAVDAAVSAGVAVHPHRWRDPSAGALAARVGAHLADGTDGAPSLSPASLVGLGRGARVVLPSPNGSTCAALAAGAGATVVAACLRNAAAVSAWLNARATTTVTVVACGERWHDGSLRPALEDHLGAGAVIAGLDGDRSPEAQAAAAVWRDVEGRVGEALRACSSGREQQQRGWADDLRYAEAVNTSSAVPVLRDGAFVDGR
ncbi:MAG TPA: 2-phosphosulfolactate phosphatase [Acidimicrobiales bacterium]